MDVVWNRKEGRPATIEEKSGTILPRLFAKPVRDLVAKVLEEHNITVTQVAVSALLEVLGLQKHPGPVAALARKSEDDVQSAAELIAVLVPPAVAAALLKEARALSTQP